MNNNLDNKRPSVSKLSPSNPSAFSRLKKYDTYQQRGTGRRFDELTGTSQAGVMRSSNTKVSPSGKPVANSDINQTGQSTQPKASSHIAPLARTNPQRVVASNQRKHTVSPGTSQGNSSAGSLAMRAVVKSEFSREHRPINTLYGTVKRKLSLLQKTMYGFGVLILVFSMFVSVQSFITNKDAKEQIATLGDSTNKDDQGVSQGTGDEPSEEEVSQSAISAYQVPNPLDPRYLRIPELGVFARVKNLGIDKKGAVDAPWNIYDTGWYNGSVRPGSRAGASLILGHVSGWTGPGVFKNINKLVAGAQFEIEKGNGDKVTYRVTRTEQLPMDQIDMAAILRAEESGKHDVKLMTCSGKYNRETKTFEERFVVYAKPLN